MIDEIPNEWKPAYTAIGCLATNWACTEYMLDHLIATVHHHFDGYKVEPKPPVSFNRKSTYLRAAFSAHSALAEHLPRLNELLEEATQISEQRAWCMHGFIDIRSATGTFPISKIIHKAARIETKPFSIEKVYTLAARATALTVNLSIFGISTVWVETQNDLNEVIREFLSKNGLAVLPVDNSAG